MPNSDIRQSILDLLRNLTFENLKQLFWGELAYDRVNEALSRRGWSDTATNALAENPILFAVGGTNKDFHILYARLKLDNLLLSLQRPVISALLKEHPYSLIVLSNAKQDHWHFVNVKYDDDVARRKIFRRIVVGPHERLRTAAERIAMLDLEAVQKTLSGLDALAIQTAHDNAFDVEAVTEQFFGYYQVVFDMLQKDLRKQTRDGQWAHDYSQQFLNRVMFLYFIQRKRWVGDDPEFVGNYWNVYKKSGAPKDSFYRDWLTVLFFEAFNNQFQAGRSDRKHLPKKYLDALAMAPYLNGGLFSQNGLDGKHSVKIGDDIFVALFDRFDDQAPGFFERYNFTIREDSPFDQEVAVDPEMIGKVYESLVNVTSEGVEEEDQRGNAGIFYTQRIEIDLMCRLSVVDYLANHLDAKFKPLLYEAVFAYENADKQPADKALAQAKLWGPINELLRKLTVCDPACGSGSFIVGMLMGVDDLQARANAQIGIKETTYQRRKRIIGQSLYGVDVMDWAVRTAELRLWLQLIVETDMDAAEMKIQPLLPNLSFKLRVGDSLVQQVGGIIFHIDHAHSAIPAALKRKLTVLKEEKLKFYNDVRSSKFKSGEAVKKEELSIFREILDAEADRFGERVRALKREIAKPPEQIGLLGMENPKAAAQLDLFLKQKREDLETAQGELSEVESARTALRTSLDVPFVWDIAFVEIFENEEKGFCIMVGNPPYVRQEMIAPPLLSEEAFKPNAWREKKKEYKEQLQRAVAEAFPKFFNYHGSDKFRKLDGKSDLYVYFYLLGLKRLNAQGSFCFITSNSWLDVGYGKDLQEFLLTQSHVKMILDNEKKRSFKQAQVNTVIALLAPPMLTKTRSAEKIVRFVMFRTPFENVLSPVVFQEVENTLERKSTPEYRVMPMAQHVLLAEGITPPEDEDETQARALGTTKYEGGKWGGQYLRGPDVFFDIIEKRRLLCRFGELAEHIQRNNLQNLRHEVVLTREECPDGFPFLSSVKDVNTIRINPRNLPKVIDPKGQRSAKWLVPDVISNRFVGARLCFFEGGDFLISDTFFIASLKREYKKKTVLALLNSTLSLLMMEQLGRKNMGGGVLCIYGPELSGQILLHPRTLGAQVTELESRYNKLAIREIKHIAEEVDAPDRRALDEVVFDALKLTRGERDAVYEAVVDLVKKRLEKAGSV